MYLTSLKTVDWPPLPVGDMVPSVTSVGSHHWRVIHSHFLILVPKDCDWPSLGDTPPLGKSTLELEAKICKNRTATQEPQVGLGGLWWSW